jgi:hypothetical protein
MERLRPLAKAEGDPEDIRIMEEWVYRGAIKTDMTDRFDHARIYQRVALSENAHMPRQQFISTRIKKGASVCLPFTELQLSKLCRCPKGTYGFDSVKIAHDSTKYKQGY